ncbi:hypothetical protein CEXT_369921 [Caerostris extrusa]|uniref:Uncharacterized protein n=1 Tax=Caerostris extrusa TaxID=172846 RepID=A0AAV4UNN5_CAEEX|nr:hypothetical protein CEXT_369921 [Caerostris extrusa]
MLLLQTTKGRVHAQERSRTGGCTFDRHCDIKEYLFFLFHYFPKKREEWRWQNVSVTPSQDAQDRGAQWACVIRPRHCVRLLTLDSRKDVFGVTRFFFLSLFF